MEGLQSWLPWIMVGAVGLGPILTFWMAMPPTPTNPRARTRG
jgi:hypothetical protein